MPKVSPEVLAAVQAAFERYVSEVEDSGYAKKTEDTYIDRAHLFVRWLNDDFEFGVNLPRR